MSTTAEISPTNDQEDLVLWCHMDMTSFDLTQEVPPPSPLAHTPMVENDYYQMHVPRSMVLM